MEALQQALIDYGYWGMLLSAILAGSVVPFSSEVVMLGLLAAGLEKWPLIMWATVGNVMGAILTYYMGRLGRIDWIEKYFHVKREKLEKTQRWLNGRGAWVAFWGFIPIFGNVLLIALGLMRSNIPITFTSMTAGKFLRYVLLAYGISLAL
jgi:membrane protein YqaA with SNARE-associated domain